MIIFCFFLKFFVILLQLSQFLFFPFAPLHLAPQSHSQSPHSVHVSFICAPFCVCFLWVLFSSVLPSTPSITEHSQVSSVCLPSLCLRSESRLTRQSQLLSRILVTDCYGYCICSLNYLTNSRVIFSFSLRELLDVLWIFSVLEYFV